MRFANEGDFRKVFISPDLAKKERERVTSERRIEGKEKKWRTGLVHQGRKTSHKKCLEREGDCKKKTLKTKRNNLYWLVI